MAYRRHSIRCYKVSVSDLLPLKKTRKLVCFSLLDTPCAAGARSPFSAYKLATWHCIQNMFRLVQVQHRRVTKVWRGRSSEWNTGNSPSLGVSLFLCPNPSGSRTTVTVDWVLDTSNPFCAALALWIPILSIITCRPEIHPTSLHATFDDRWTGRLNIAFCSCFSKIIQKVSPKQGSRCCWCQWLIRV